MREILHILIEVGRGELMAKINKNSTRIKVFLIMAIFLVGVNLLISATFHGMSQSFYTNEGEFKYYEVRDKGTIFLDDLSRELVVNIVDDSSNDISFSNEFTLSYLDRDIRVITRNYSNDGFQVLDSEGNIYTEVIEVVNGEVIRNHGDIYELSNDIQLAYGTNKVMTYLDNAVESFKKFIFLAILSLFGSFLIVLPNLAVKVETLFLIKEKKILDKIIGVNVLIGLVLIVISLFLNIVLFL